MEVSVKTALSPAGRCAARGWFANPSGNAQAEPGRVGSTCPHQRPAYRDPLQKVSCGFEPLCVQRESSLECIESSWLEETIKFNHNPTPALNYVLRFGDFVSIAANILFFLLGFTNSHLLHKTPVTKVAECTYRICTSNYVSSRKQ